MIDEMDEYEEKFMPGMAEIIRREAWQRAGPSTALRTKDTRGQWGDMRKNLNGRGSKDLPERYLEAIHET